MAGRFQLFFLGDVESSAVHKKNVGPAVVIVIKNRHAASGGFNDVLLSIDASINVFHAESSLRSHVNEPGRTRVSITRIDRLIRRYRSLLYRGGRLFDLCGGHRDGKADQESHTAANRSPTAHPRIVPLLRRMQLSHTPALMRSSTAMARIATCAFS